MQATRRKRNRPSNNSIKFPLNGFATFLVNRLRSRFLVKRLSEATKPAKQQNKREVLISFRVTKNSIAASPKPHRSSRREICFVPRTRFSHFVNHFPVYCHSSDQQVVFSKPKLYSSLNFTRHVLCLVYKRAFIG